jgi:hypothetical protein
MLQMIIYTRSEILSLFCNKADHISCILVTKLILVCSSQVNKSSVGYSVVNDYLCALLELRKEQADRSAKNWSSEMILSQELLIY